MLHISVPAHAPLSNRCFHAAPPASPEKLRFHIKTTVAQRSAQTSGSDHIRRKQNSATA